MIEKLTLLNKTILDFINENNEIKIVGAFTEVGKKILGADFGFTWLNSPHNAENLRLAYKSKNLPFKPRTPTEAGRNRHVMSTGQPNFVTHVEQEIDAKYVAKYIESFVVIPIFYWEKAYGTIVLCFKKRELFPKEKRILSIFLGNSVAQVITIHQ